LQHGDERVRAAAAEAIAQLGPTHPETLPALRKALVDVNARVRSEAAEALGSLALAARPAAEDLIDTLNDPDQSVREEAAETLTRMRMLLPDADAALRDRIESALLGAKPAPE
jgi:HEAT repeat protein